jgi:mono/diheme cytochrome c family protein
MRYLVVLALLLGAPVMAASMAPAASPGIALFEEKCAMCHRGRGMGTILLARRMAPAIADLEKRTDLAPETLRAVVRGGIGNMPAIPRGEVSDAQLDAIADYLARRKAP